MSHRSLNRIMALLAGVSACLSFGADRLQAQVPDSVRAKLEQRITLDDGFPSETNLNEAIQTLCKLTGAKIEADQNEFRVEAMIDAIGEQTVQLPKLKEVECAAVLRALLPQLNAVYEVRDNTVVIVPARGRKWLTLPMTPQRAKCEADIRRRLAEKVTLDKAVVANTPEAAAAILSEEFGVSIVARLSDVGKVQIDPVRDITLGTLLQRLPQKSSLDTKWHRCTYEVDDKLVVLSIRPISFANLLGSPTKGDPDPLTPSSLPRDLEEQVKTILVAKNALQAWEGYRMLFAKAGASGIRQLQNHQNDGIALQAAWQEVALTLPEKEPESTTRPDGHRLAWFIGFVEGRLRTPMPAWWKEAVLDSRALSRDNIYPGHPNEDPYHRSGLDGVYCPQDTILRKKGGKLTLQVGKDSVAIPQELLEHGKIPEENVSARFTSTRCCVTIHSDYGGFLGLTCIDRATDKVLWKSNVWGPRIGGGFTGYSEAWVSVTEQDGRVIVFGAGDMGLHVEGFRADDGKPLFRFSSYR